MIQQLHNFAEESGRSEMRAIVENVVDALSDLPEDERTPMLEAMLVAHIASAIALARYASTMSDQELVVRLFSVEGIRLPLRPIDQRVSVISEPLVLSGDKVESFLRERTDLAREALEHDETMVLARRNDVWEQERVAKRKCRLCHYSSRLERQMISKYTCKLCGAHGKHPTTAVPILCSTCADKHAACVQCGADLQVRPRS